MKSKFLLLLFAVFSVGVITIGCSKNKNGTTLLKVNLTDNPYNASEVNVDIQQVRVNLSNDSSGWINLGTETGIYNLLDFQNGIDTVIAQGMVPTGMLKEIRFVLGTENSIVINNVEYPLTIPSGSESGLKIKLNKALNATLDSMTVDFDAALSIHQDGMGDYILSPVLQVK